MGEKIIKLKIVEAIRAIPAGVVRSYGQVAADAGYPGRARLVARILSESDYPDLPWHRVLRSSGQIAFPAGSDMFNEQSRRLLAEGVAVTEGRVKLPGREVDMDSLLWAPDYDNRL